MTFDELSAIYARARAESPSIHEWVLLCSPLTVDEWSPLAQRLYLKAVPHKYVPAKWMYLIGRDEVAGLGAYEPIHLGWPEWMLPKE